MCFGGSGRQPVLITEPPKVSDPEVEAALEKERELARRRKGRRSTILTGGQGLVPDEQGGRRTLG